MGIMKLAAGAAVGYVLGARAGREKYERIVAVAQQVSGRSGARAEPRTGALPAEAEAVVVSSPRQPAPDTGDQPRRPRKRRPKAGTGTATPDATATPSAGSAADSGPDDLLVAAGEADIAEQKALVVDTRDEPARSSQTLDGDSADVLEQRRSV